jgi:tRNA pseudouridine55 synthase
MSGFVLNVYKEIPWTSFDAISRIRRILDIRQVGHAGSLDPFASGVLLVAVGRATKLVPHLMDLPKSYKGTFILGRRTSTGDAMGLVVEEGPAPAVGQEELGRLAAGFVGTIQQVPPMVSALKHEGKRLCDLARRGVEIERAPRAVRVDRFEITGVESPRVDFELDCGRGTYVRTLVEDLAARISSVASIESLTRSRIGRFEVGESCRLISFPCSERAGLTARAIPMADAVSHLPGVKVEGRWIRNLRQGILPPWKGMVFDTPPTFGATVRLLGPERELLALATMDLLPGPADRPVEQSCTLRLERVL